MERPITPAGSAALRRQEEANSGETRTPGDFSSHTPTTETTTSEHPKDTGEQHISLKVVDQAGTEVHFKIKRVTDLEKLMSAYCARQAISPTSVRFLYDGKRVQGGQTAKSLEMENDDIIDAVLQQTGGCTLYIH